jgi:hypothetical protein
MIKEICQFIETLEEETPDLFEEGGKPNSFIVF